MVATPASEKPLVCPIMFSPVNEKSTAVEYAGGRYAFCCAGCDKTFAKDPQAAMKKADKGGHVIATFLFDPVTGKKIDTKKAEFSSDYKGTRYFFASSDNKTAFDKNSKKYATVPKKEHLQCAVEGCEVNTYSDSSGYADVEGVRYYAGCEGCVGKLLEDPKKYATKEGLTTPKAIPVEKKD